MNKKIEDYITENICKLSKRYVQEKELGRFDLKLDLKALKEATELPEHLIFIVREFGTYLLFRSKENAKTIINYYKDSHGERYYIFNTKKDIAYKKINWMEALKFTAEYPE